MILYFDKDGTPMETLEWAKKFEDFMYRIVSQDMVGKYLISTVWLGLTYSSLSLPVGTFETMIFDRESMRPAHDLYCERYNTLDEAKIGHLHSVAMVREAEGINGTVDNPTRLDN